MLISAKPYQRALAVGLILLTSMAARAQDLEATPMQKILPQSADQVIYKGVVGNLLEAMPIDPARRVDLQRTNAVISNPLSARSLAVLLGVASPVLMIGGLIWGIWAASQIKPVTPEAVHSASLPPVDIEGKHQELQSGTALNPHDNLVLERPGTPDVLSPSAVLFGRPDELLTSIPFPVIFGPGPDGLPLQGAAPDPVEIADVLRPSRAEATHRYGVGSRVVDPQADEPGTENPAWFVVAQSD